MISNDPACMVNLAEYGFHDNILQKLRTQLEEELKEQGDPSRVAKFSTVTPASTPCVRNWWFCRTGGV